jgi:hypothetical protein
MFAGCTLIAITACGVAPPPPPPFPALTLPQPLRAMAVIKAKTVCIAEPVDLFEPMALVSLQGTVT